MSIELEMTLVTGRTMKQGVGLVLGKESEEYKKEVSMVELCPEDMEELQLETGDSVCLLTEHGSATFVARAVDMPRGLVFIPFGPPANTLIGCQTGASGMPDSKGASIKVKRL